AQSGIDHQLDILADALPRGASECEIAFLTLSHRPPAELDCTKALFDQIAADPLSLGRRVAEQDRRIRAESLTESTAEQLVDRPLPRLPHDIPQRYFHSAHRLNGRSLPAVENRPLVHAMHEPVNLEGVLPNHALGQPAAYLV